MFHSDIHARHLATWLVQDAVPLWTRRAFDPGTGLMWEALDHTGTPRIDMPRRLRVQARQVFCMARLSRRDPAKLALAEALFRRLMATGFDRHGHLVHRFDPIGQPMDAPHDLYDHAFMLLAAAALARAGCDVTHATTRLLASLARLRRRDGWAENAQGTGPRRQNPHMHLFEAATEWLSLGPDARFDGIARECLRLFRSRALQPDGTVLEFFDARFRPLHHAQQVEPGHIAEWIWLLHRYETVTGRKSGVNPTSMAQVLASNTDATGLLPDIVDIGKGERRLWPQTELLKAALVLQQRKISVSGLPDPTNVLDGLWRDYLDTPVPGGWYDQRDGLGQVISDSMPVSSFYHILPAIEAFLARRPRVTARAAA